MTAENIIRSKRIPAFGKMKMREIETKHITVWQNELLTYGRPVICMEMNRCEC